jgi:hypothetical protein
LVFLAGQDAGPGSAHPLANVWDNGPDPVDELRRVMRVRTKALKTFTADRIPEGTPMATLEDVLVPVYLFHRYQIEAAASVLGGLVYNHTLKGDVQASPSIVGGGEQRHALDALLETLEPGQLMIPEELLSIIPPRPPGYRQTRELFPGFTGDTFDPLAAAEAASRITVTRILHPHRASRMIEYHARKPDVPGLLEVLERLIESTWKQPTKGRLDAQVQCVVDRVILDEMMRLCIDSRASRQARAIVWQELTDLETWLVKQIRREKDEDRHAHFTHTQAILKRFLAEADDIELPHPIEIPPGAPIGTR